MKKTLFLIALTVFFSSCAGTILRQEEDCMNACSMVANDLVKVIPQGCVCQEKEKK